MMRRDVGRKEGIEGAGALLKNCTLWLVGCAREVRLEVRGRRAGNFRSGLAKMTPRNSRKRPDLYHVIQRLIVAGEVESNIFIRESIRVYLSV